MKHRSETAARAVGLQRGIALACHQSVRYVPFLSWVFHTAVTKGGEFSPFRNLELENAGIFLVAGIVGIAVF